MSATYDLSTNQFGSLATATGDRLVLAGATGVSGTIGFSIIGKNASDEVQDLTAATYRAAYTDSTNSGSTYLARNQVYVKKFDLDADNSFSSVDSVFNNLAYDVTNKKITGDITGLQDGQAMGVSFTKLGGAINNASGNMGLEKQTVNTNLLLNPLIVNGGPLPLNSGWYLTMEAISEDASETKANVTVRAGVDGEFNHTTGRYQDCEQVRVIYTDMETLEFKQFDSDLVTTGNTGAITDAKEVDFITPVQRQYEFSAAVIDKAGIVSDYVYTQSALTAGGMPTSVQKLVVDASNQTPGEVVISWEKPEFLGTANTLTGFKVYYQFAPVFNTVTDLSSGDGTASGYIQDNSGNADFMSNVRDDSYWVWDLAKATEVTDPIAFDKDQPNYSTTLSFGEAKIGSSVMVWVRPSLPGNVAGRQLGPVGKDNQYAPANTGGDWSGLFLAKDKNTYYMPTPHCVVFSGFESVPDLSACTFEVITGSATGFDAADQRQNFQVKYNIDNINWRSNINYDMLGYVLIEDSSNLSGYQFPDASFVDLVVDAQAEDPDVSGDYVVDLSSTSQNIWSQDANENWVVRSGDMLLGKQYSVNVVAMNGVGLGNRKNTAIESFVAPPKTDALMIPWFYTAQGISSETYGSSALAEDICSILVSTNGRYTVNITDQVSAFDFGDNTVQFNRVAAGGELFNAFDYKLSVQSLDNVPKQALLDLSINSVNDICDQLMQLAGEHANYDALNQQLFINRAHVKKQHDDWGTYETISIANRLPGIEFSVSELYARNAQGIDLVTGINASAVKRVAFQSNVLDNATPPQISGSFKNPAHDICFGVDICAATLTQGDLSYSTLTAGTLAGTVGVRFTDLSGAAGTGGRNIDSIEYNIYQNVDDAITGQQTKRVLDVGSIDTGIAFSDTQGLQKISLLTQLDGTNGTANPLPGYQVMLDYFYLSDKSYKLGEQILLELDEISGGTSLDYARDISSLTQTKSLGTPFTTSDEVTSMTAKQLSPTSFQLSWGSAPVNPDHLVRYEVQLYDCVNMGATPSASIQNANRIVNINAQKTRTYTFTGLVPGKQYVPLVRTVTTQGDSAQEVTSNGKAMFGLSAGDALKVNTDDGYEISNTTGDIPDEHVFQVQFGTSTNFKIVNTAQPAVAQGGYFGANPASGFYAISTVDKPSISLDICGEGVNAGNSLKIVDNNTPLNFSAMIQVSASSAARFQSATYGNVLNTTGTSGDNVFFLDLSAVTASGNASTSATILSDETQSWRGRTTTVTQSMLGNDWYKETNYIFAANSQGTTVSTVNASSTTNTNTIQNNVA